MTTTRLNFVRDGYLRRRPASVFPPVSSRISRRACRQTSQDVCPWNVRLARPLGEPAYAPREALAGKGARALARELLGLTQAEFSAAFKGSPMKRAKLRGLRRNASVVLGNVGSSEDVPVLVDALSDDEPLVRGHAAWALGRLGSAAALAPLRARADVETEPWVLDELRTAARALEGRAARSTSSC